MFNITFPRFELPKTITDNAPILFPAAVAGISLLALKIVSDLRKTKEAKEHYEYTKNLAVTGTALTGALAVANIATFGRLDPLMAGLGISYIGTSTLVGALSAGGAIYHGIGVNPAKSAE
ncbi:MAG: hypothetical protein JSS09_05885 [Verrucomicrobia bacterium]|nr:hypothetical protein [Verrucomicrobiota bacterium]